MYEVAQVEESLRTSAHVCKLLKSVIANNLAQNNILYF